MITKINIKKLATYKENAEIIPSKINFIYGNNGVGKTSVARLIEKPSLYPYSNLEWNDIPCEVLAYNRDFVKTNFNNETKIRGIYTLGEESEEKLKEITNLNTKLNILEKQLSESKENLTKLKELQNKLKKDSYKAFWDNYKKKYCDLMLELYKGNISSMESFFNKCLTIEDIDNSIQYEQIYEEYTNLYTDSLEKKDSIELIDIIDITSIINSPIFKEVIKEDKTITLSQLIDDLDNSSWVKDGIKYIKSSNNKCPFCQQEISSDFIHQIQALYGEKYQKQMDELNAKTNTFLQLYEKYKKIVEDNSYIFKDSSLVLDFISFMDSIKSECNSKITNPKYICSFNNDISILKNINSLIEKENIKIKQNNDKLENIDKSKKELSTKAWTFIRSIGHVDIINYINLNNDYTNKIENITKTISENNVAIKEIKSKITEIQNSISGISKTINRINNTLKKFNFNNFILKENDDNLTYSIIRPNGEDATQTLSEGEFSFISFLYFYHLVFGSRNKSGFQNKHVLIIDDPVTSMDSNVLFIISTLIRELIDLCAEEKRNIEQIFIFSHNIYFFKEVSYRYGQFGKSAIRNKYRFFIIQKINGISSIENKQNENPIKNSYELLWQSLRKRDYTDESNLNTMRRILEQYFNTIGNGSPNNNNKDFINKFEEKDRLIVKSLLSYINDGSHSIMDGLYIAPDINLNENAFRIFKDIFDKLGHINHYKMMMKEEY